MAGRPRKYTPLHIQAILDALSDGLPRRHACIKGDISEDTFAIWLRIHSDFSEAVKKAEAHAVAERVSRIRSAAIGGAVVKRVTTTKESKGGEVTTTTTEEYTRPEWTADAWLLERRYRDDFGRQLDIRIERERILEDTRALATEKGLDPDAAVAEVETILRGR